MEFSIASLTLSNSSRKLAALLKISIQVRSYYTHLQLVLILPFSFILKKLLILLHEFELLTYIFSPLIFVQLN